MNPSALELGLLATAIGVGIITAATVIGTWITVALEAGALGPMTVGG